MSQCLLPAPPQQYKMSKPLNEVRTSHKSSSDIPHACTNMQLEPLRGSQDAETCVSRKYPTPCFALSSLSMKTEGLQQVCWAGWE